jgi:hypothetical protein
LFPTNFLSSPCCCFADDSLDKSFIVVVSFAFSVNCQHVLRLTGNRVENLNLSTRNKPVPPTVHPYCEFGLGFVEKSGRGSGFLLPRHEKYTSQNDGIFFARRKKLIDIDTSNFVYITISFTQAKHLQL